MRVTKNGMQQRRWILTNIILLISGIALGVTLPVLAYYLYWYIGLVMEETELHKDNTDER